LHKSGLLLSVQDNKIDIEYRLTEKCTRMQKQKKITRIKKAACAAFSFKQFVV